MLRRRYRMLVAEPDDGVTGVLTSITRHWADLDVEIVRTMDFRETVRTLITDAHIDVAIVDLRLPDMMVPSALEELAIKAPRAALVALTTDTDQDVDLIRAGVLECIQVDELSPQLLKRAIVHAVERKGVERRMLRMADSDLLTGIGNRRQLRNRYEVLRAEHSRRGGELVAVIFNIDGFDEYNAQFGLKAGDETLRRIAMVLLEQVRLEDVVARLGGDEFAIAVLDESASHAAEIVRRVHEAMVDAVSELPTPIGVSGGGAFALDDVSHRDLLGRADAVLTQVKAERPGTVLLSPVAAVEAA